MQKNHVEQQNYCDVSQDLQDWMDPVWPSIVVCMLSKAALAYIKCKQMLVKVKIKHFYLLLIVQELEIGLIVNTKLLLFKTSIIIYITEWEKQAWVENTLLYNLVSQNGTHLQRYFSKVFGNDILNCSLCRGQIWKLHQIICSISINIKLSFKSSSSLYNVQVYI